MYSRLINKYFASGVYWIIGMSDAAMRTQCHDFAVRSGTIYGLVRVLGISRDKSSLGLKHHTRFWPPDVTTSFNYSC